MIEPRNSDVLCPVSHCTNADRTGRIELVLNPTGNGRKRGIVRHEANSVPTPDDLLQIGSAVYRLADKLLCNEDERQADGNRRDAHRYQCSQVLIPEPFLDPPMSRIQDDCQHQRRGQCGQKRQRQEIADIQTDRRSGHDAEQSHLFHIGHLFQVGHLAVSQTRRAYWIS
ncbi:hypothetical protein [Mesorhizobium sp.]|uniref:hypothetical protein n=1 Tax=Mesorhizobium sp. TaxID=1871066 RepID=UPI0025D5564B|nr:hypothetical protein [Mesorhizobium sp.]